MYNIIVDEGCRVAKGEELMIIDAIRIKIKSGIEGRMKKVMVEKGAKIPKGIVLFEME